MTLASCPLPERLAAAASGDDAEAAAHAASCATCRDQLATQTAMRSLLHRLPAPPLVADQRRTLEAVVQARADELADTTPRRRPTAIVGIVAFAAAATVALAIGVPRGAHEDDAVPSTQPRSTGTVGTVTPAPAPAPSPSPSPSLASSSSDTPSRPSVALRAVIDLSAADADRVSPSGTSPATHDEVVTLRGGTMIVDARERRAPVDVVTGSTTLHVADAKVKITAFAGKVSHVEVIAGSVQMDRNGQHTVIHDDWTAPAAPSASPAAIEPKKAPASDDVTSLDPPSRAGTPSDHPARGNGPDSRTKPDAPVTRAQRAMTEFRAGWAELHAEHFPEAIAHFDRATDPVVSEDATYWAAIACERAGKQDEAVTRLRAFVTAFPKSPRHADARRVLTKLGH